MSDLEEKEAVQTSQGGGVSQATAKRRKKRVLAEASRCAGRLPTGRRCEAARLRHSSYCVFHDPEMVERRLRLAETLPYQFPDDVQRLLAEAVEAVKKKRLSPRAGNTLGYLATLLLQNQRQVEKEKDRVAEAQYNAEMQAGLHEIQLERAERLGNRREAEEAEEKRD